MPVAARHPTRLARFVIGMLMLLWAAFALADYRTPYKAGVTAFSRGRWADAVTSMRQAIAENPQESAQKVLIYGSWYEPYLPHYYLGVALSKLNRCDEAMSELQSSDSAGVIASFRKQYGELQAAFAKCSPAPGPVPDVTPPKPDLPVTTTTAPPPAPKVSPDIIRAANSAIQSAASTASNVRKAVVADPRVAVRLAQGDFNRREREASEQLDSAQRALQKAASEVSEAGYREATRLANEARSHFEKLGAEASQVAQAVRGEETQLASARDALQKQLGASRGLLETRDDPARADLKAGRTSLTAAINKGESVARRDSLAELQLATRSLADAAASLQQMRRKAPEAGGIERTVLTQAIGTYLRNDYQGTLDVLSVSAVTSALGRAQVALFRAAASFALYEQTGRKDSARLATAHEEIGRYASLSKRDPDPRVFTPKFITLYRNVQSRIH